MSLYEGAVGVVIEYTVLDSSGQPLNISAASSKKLIFRKPDRVILEKNADFVTDGSDGKLKYTTVEGDLVPHGNWRAQADIIVPGVVDGRTEVEVFDVGAILK